MSTDPGLDILKKSRLVCPFVTTPEQYGMESAAEIFSFCWFKAENMATERGRPEPIFVECAFTADFESCPIYQTNVPPL